MATAPQWTVSENTTEYRDGIFFVEGPASNWIIVREGRSYVLVDSGYPADTGRVLESIRYAGLEPERAAALLITHGHVDHIGAAAHFAQTYSTPVLASAAGALEVTGTETYQVTLPQVLLRAWNPRVFRWILHALDAGALKPRHVESTALWPEDALARLPGSPKMVATVGHTPGSVAYHFPDAAAAATGDALVTGHPISRIHGPQMLHPMFHHNPAQALSALDSLTAVEASLILPGHGPAVEGDLSTLAASVRARKPGRPVAR